MKKEAKAEETNVPKLKLLPYLNANQLHHLKAIAVFLTLYLKAKLKNIMRLGMKLEDKEITDKQ